MAAPATLTTPALAAAENVPETEKIPENVGEIAECGRIETRKRLTLDSLVAEAVVACALFRVGEDGVGLRRFFEPLLGRVIPGVPVRVVLHRELAVGLLDLGHRGIAGDTQDNVIVSSFFGTHWSGISFPLPGRLPAAPFMSKPRAAMGSTMMTWVRI